VSPDAQTDAPPYARLRDAIRSRIESGELLPGDRVPTVRAYAAHAGLSPNTVARAYRALEMDGWLVGRGRAGTFVADEPPERSGDRDGRLASAASVYLRRAERLGFTHDEAIEALRGR
jgi:DNA-binding transcriptional regulator YhcF (GntR family)